MPISLTMFLATLSSIFRSRAALQLENLALRHQIGVLQRSTRRRPRLTPVDRLVWVWLSRVWSGWRSTLAIVHPIPSLPGIVLASAFSGLGRSSVADRDDPPFLARFAI